MKTNHIVLFLALSLSSAIANATCDTTPMYPIPGGDHARQIENVLRAGCNAVLAQGTVWDLTTLSSTGFAAIDFNGAANVSIYTAGLPHWSYQKALLRLINSQTACAVKANQGEDNAQLRNIRIDGGGTNCGMACHTQALVWFGGAGATGQIVDSVELFNARAWTHIVFEGSCDWGQITNSVIGPSDPLYTNAVTDGISLQCRHTEVWQNLITDVTDGGIVVFASAYSHIRDNEIRNDTRSAIAGIAMVDYYPDGNFEGVVVSGNRIYANQFVKFGIAMGRRIHDSCPNEDLIGTASVTDNTLFGTQLGYGYVIDGVNNWEVKRNTIDPSARHVGYGISACVTPPPPGSFLIHRAHAPGANYQTEFRDRGPLDGAHAEY